MNAIAIPELAEPSEPSVWVLEKGDRYEGGGVIGIYTDRDLAKNDVVELATAMDALHRRVYGTGVDVSVEADGTINIASKAEWLSLAPRALVTRTNRLALNA
jgi:hypothetical protein